MLTNISRSPSALTLMYHMHALMNTRKIPFLNYSARLARMLMGKGSWLWNRRAYAFAVDMGSGLIERNGLNRRRARGAPTTISVRTGCRAELDTRAMLVGTAKTAGLCSMARAIVVHGFPELSGLPSLLCCWVRCWLSASGRLFYVECGLSPSSVSPSTTSRLRRCGALLVSNSNTIGCIIGGTSSPALTWSATRASNASRTFLTVNGGGFMPPFRSPWFRWSRWLLFATALVARMMPPFPPWVGMC